MTETRDTFTIIRRLALISIGVASISLPFHACEETGSTDGAGNDRTAGERTSAGGAVEATFELTSRAFEHGGAIPTRHSKNAQNASPPLTWSGAPGAVVQYAIIVDDPDAPSEEPWVHWVIYNIEGDVTSLPEGVPPVPEVLEPIEAAQGLNSWNDVGWGGPSPPGGETHRYRFMIYALDADLDLKPGLTRGDVEKAIDGYVVAMDELVGSYSTGGGG